MTNEEEVAWCENIWNMIRDGGVWAIPRSGLIFEKREGERQLVLTKRMPHETSMPLTARRLREQQDGDIAAVGLRFEQLGISIVAED